jgi:uncharacterized membrane protein
MISARAIGYLVFLAVVSGCSGHGVGTTPGSMALTIDHLKKATYRGILDDPVTLVEGRYEGEPFEPGASSRPVVRLVPGMVSTGDLTGDGKDEAVVVLAHNSGGSGVFMYLAVMQQTRGGPDNIATVHLGDRVKVIDIEISDGKIRLQLVQHGPKDPMCCPTLQVNREWSLHGNQLVETKQPAKPRGSRVRGHLVWGHESRSFTECDTGREAWVFNESGDELTAVYEELTAAPYQPMFVEVRGMWEDVPTDGFGADYGAALRIVEFLRAENEGFGCRLDLDGVLFVASGNEPFWRLQVREDGISLRSMDVPEEVEFGAPETSEYADLVTYHSSNSRGTEIRITLQQGRCVDTMSGARYAWTASVDIDGKRLTGCAAEGL